jgi:hypothetical protein
VSSVNNAKFQDCDKISNMSVKMAPRAKKNLKEVCEIKVERPERAKLSAEESLKRTEAFDERREQFIATIRQGKN